MSALSFARDLAFRPSRALERLSAPGAALPESLRIYAVYLLASAAFSLLRPAGFPAEDAALAVSLEGRGASFWIGVQAWDTLLLAALALFLGWQCWLLRPDRPGFPPPRRRILASFLLGCLPALPLLLFVAQAIPRAALLAALLLWLAGLLPGLRRRDPAGWRPLASLALALSVPNLAALPALALATALRSQQLYAAAEAAVLLWTLALGSFLLGRLERLPTSRAFASLLLSLLWQLVLLASLYFLGAVSKDVLRAAMTL